MSVGRKKERKEASNKWLKYAGRNGRAKIHSGLFAGCVYRVHLQGQLIGRVNRHLQSLDSTIYLLWQYKGARWVDGVDILLECSSTDTRQSILRAGHSWVVNRKTIHMVNCEDAYEQMSFFRWGIDVLQQRRRSSRCA